MSDERNVQDFIRDLVTSKRVFLFMKGNKFFPQCGFSARVVQLLQATEADFDTFDVLSDPDVRQGIKEFANWPTIPQLYVDGEFVGGSDIVTELYQSGELATMVAASE